MTDAFTEAARLVLGNRFNDTYTPTADEYRAIRAEENRIEREQATAPIEAGGPPRGAPVTTPDYIIAAQLIQEAGGTEAEAWKSVAAPGTVQGMRDAINARLLEMQAEADARAAAEYQRTPAGLQEAAAAIRAEREAEAKLVADGRLLLEQRHGDVSRLTDREILDHSGLVPSPDRITREEDERLANDLDANLKALADQENTP
jgi:hypothetical protein